MTIAGVPVGGAYPCSSNPGFDRSGSRPGAGVCSTARASVADPLRASRDPVPGSTEHLRERFVADRDALRAGLRTDDLAAAARLVSPDGPTPFVEFRDSPLLIDHAMQRFAHARRRTDSSPPIVIVMPPRMPANGHPAEYRIESGNDLSCFAHEMFRVARSSSLVPRRVGDQPVESWQILRWSLDHA